jgi:energy-coupling factor transporter ATP-binding protein EcfA2
LKILLRGAGYTYPAAARPAVSGVDLRVEPGEVVVLAGPTGCGKSTLLRLAAGLLQRHGQGAVSGEVLLGDADPAALSPAARVRRLGFVSQEPGDQLVAATVADEVAFAMASAAMDPAEMDAAVPRLLAAVGLAVDPDRATSALSGGQTQRLVVAAALAADARLLLLDEPLAQLDPAGARALLGRLRALADAGVGVLLVEHRLEPCLAVADRVVLMDGGRVVRDDAVDAWRPGGAALPVARGLGLTLPGLVDLADRLGGLPDALPPRAAPVLLAVGARLAHVADATFAYDADPVLHGVTLSVRRGERIALLGGNGAGKSTLLRLLSGELPSGGVTVDGRRVAVPQDPDLALFCRTTRDELAYGPVEQRVDPAPRVRAAAAALSLTDLLDRPPQALSRGQRLRVAVAAALTCAPELLLLDEPTAGQDHDQVERMLLALREALAEGALVFATHDVDLALRHATRVVVMDGGRVVADGPPVAVLGAIPDGGALVLPALARFCFDRGLPPATAADLARGEG